MLKKILYAVIILSLVMGIGIGCKKSTGNDKPDPNPNPNPNPDPNGNNPTEQEIAKMYYHDTGPYSKYDIFTADLYIVPKPDASSTSAPKAGNLDLLKARGAKVLRPGISRFHEVDFNGSVKERVVINNFYSTDEIDISQYDFEVRNVENITQSTTDDFAVNVNSNDWITFVTAPNGIDNGNTEICYMDLADRVRHQLTPINGQYSGGNFDPDWKSTSVIVWSHNVQIVEVDINQLAVSDPIVEEVGTAQYDPKYSPDQSMILFNTRLSRVKKNSYIKYLSTGLLQTVLPQDYFNVYSDDNPNWIFSNNLLAGHIFIDGKGRIYTRDMVADDFLIITDDQRDFRYVSPIKIGADIYLIFSDWTDKGNITLWISNINGTLLRELNQTGDEVVFQLLGLPSPTSEDDLQNIALDYVRMFEH